MKQFLIILILLIPVLGLATTTNYSNVNGGSPEHYNTLTLWEADTDNNLVLLDVIEVARCYDDDGVLDDYFTVAGATTDATRYSASGSSLI